VGILGIERSMWAEAVAKEFKKEMNLELVLESS